MNKAIIYTAGEFLNSTAFFSSNILNHYIHIKILFFFNYKYISKFYFFNI